MTSKRPITKAIIAAAGYGTRFLPATKNQPKQMLPLIDKPIIHYLVEEAVMSGITDIILVTQAGNSIMEDYFDNHYELEDVLEKTGKLSYLETIRKIPEMANFIYVRQKKNLPYGNGSPLLAAKSLIDNDEAVVYMFGDDITISNGEIPVTKQLMDTYEKYQPASILAVQEVPDSDVHKYGTVKYIQNSEIPYAIDELLEKMPLGQNPSNMAQFGRFVFSYDMILEAQKIQTGLNDELWISDMQNNLAKQGKLVIAQPVNGEWMTTGDPLNYLKTTLRLAMDRKDLSKDLLKYMQELVEQNK